MSPALAGSAVPANTRYAGDTKLRRYPQAWTARMMFRFILIRDSCSQYNGETAAARSSSRAHRAYPPGGGRAPDIGLGAQQSSGSLVSRKLASGYGYLHERIAPACLQPFGVGRLYRRAWYRERQFRDGDMGALPPRQVHALGERADAEEDAALVGAGMRAGKRSGATSISRVDRCILQNTPSSCHAGHVHRPSMATRTPYH